MDDHLVGRTAVELTDLVKTGVVTPSAVLRAHLERIGSVDATYGAFQTMCVDAAIADAAALDLRDDLDALPLAGVPIAIKDNVDVAGAPTRQGSMSTDSAPRPADHPLVARLRSAGAVVVGKTKVPEWCAWAWTDSLYGVTRSPWDIDRSSGGSSGGSAAAVAAGMVPLAHGSDGGGSIRIPASCCGLFGIKPGRGVVPGNPGHSGWYGLSANGPLATTVADAALGLAVMADRPELIDPQQPQRKLRIAVSVKPLMPVDVQESYARATHETAEFLASCGHDVVPLDPPYGRDMMLAAGVRGWAGIAEESAGLAVRRMQRRSRPSVRAGRVIRRMNWLREDSFAAYRQRALDFFRDVDLLLTPTVAYYPVTAEGWAMKSWVGNMRGSSFAQFTPSWNVAGFPAAALPVRSDAPGVPPSVQLVGPPDAEGLILSVARQIEMARPWLRHPPGMGLVAS